MFECIGLDIGSSTVSCVRYLSDGANMLHTLKSVSKPMPEGEHGVYADIDALIAVVFDALRDVIDGHTRKIDFIGLTGQQHGVLLADEDMKPLTPFYSWQYVAPAEVQARVESQLSDAGLTPRMGTGFGALAVAELVTSNPALNDESVTCLTIIDLITHRLCGRVAADVTMAHSVGLIAQDTGTYDQRVLDALGIRLTLPKLAPSGTSVANIPADVLQDLGCTDSEVTVCVGLGDNQASVLAAWTVAPGSITLPKPRPVLVVGTGSQLSLPGPGRAERCRNSGHGSEGSELDGYEARPMVCCTSAEIQVRAALGGGRTLALLAGLARQFGIMAGGDDTNTGELYTSLIDEASKFLASGAKPPVLNASFWGERDGAVNLGASGTMDGLTLSNFTPGGLTCAFIHAMYSEVLGAPGTAAQLRRAGTMVVAGRIPAAASDITRAVVCDIVGSDSMLISIDNTPDMAARGAVVAVLRST
ncbi:carbohydrate kinase, FGGY family, N-terminal domain [Carpediemonas membranifera]|uniref:Carbohydrate kinase, FGGY family, N-terminal domain n=1 Tax=Carpediemonas membranifera TaxID=201153 RepID=A0A8J6EB68_9EUKA|nr:carbohydrate kinase, FGGY family, N-terminal domain [Carpediemonas membranifera]|eukprot:KAG9396415.1 carbohydrate kinase, FGGY family, N-terminal domain [Carpediemonas membranifera]